MTLSGIRHGVMKIVFMYQQDSAPLLAQLHGFLDLTAIASVCPARIPIRADDQIVHMGGDMVDDLTTQPLHDRGNAWLWQKI
ncbi:hypothetical protein ACFPAG_16410 [Vogesella sp. GCM10023246]|uniref:Uncharacterized protein n=1 Tax=Vogesella oryzagri TaxID=3160864 RepID=A0ABV1M9H1_9NEIS